MSWSKTLSVTRFVGDTITQNQNIIRFLTCGTESIVLIGMDYELTVPEAFLREYVEEVDNPGDDWYTTLTDFLDTYTYDDTEEIQNEPDRKRMPYQRFERKKGQ